MESASIRDNPVDEAADGVDGFRLLLIEDSWAMHTLIQLVLRKFGEVKSAHSGAEGVIRYREKGPFDAVLLDMELPDVHGTEVAREIRRLPEGKDVPIIVISSHSDPETIAAANAAGVTAYIPKKDLRGIDFETMFRELIETYRSKRKGT